MLITEICPSIMAARIAYELDDGQHPGKSGSIAKAIRVNKSIITGIQMRCTLKLKPNTQRLSNVQHKAKKSIIII